MTDLLATLASRGLLQDHTPGLPARVAEARPLRGYVGFDPTADSLHVGNLIPIMTLYWLQAAGGTPIALVGGGTGLIGDPSGKRSERPMLTAETIAANAAAIGAQLDRLLPPVDGRQPVRMLNNADWLRDLGVIEFLRDTGKHFTVNYMLQKEAVKSRMDTGISYTEFSYMLLQAHDFAHLFRTEGCELQMGGSDQWGNITAGIELIGRREGGEAHGLVAPLLTTAAGAKFGKSEDGNIWLDPGRTSPYKFYQFWLQTDDRDVERLLKCFTTLPLDEIAALMHEQLADPGRRVAQRRLAADMTRRVHGEERLDWVTEASRLLFGAADLAAAPEEVFAVLMAEVPSRRLPRARLTTGYSVVEALVDTGLAGSRAEARRGLDQQAFALGDEKLADPARQLTLRDALHARYLVLRRGRKHFALIEVVDGDAG